MFSTLLLMAASAATQPARSTPVVNPHRESQACPETPMSQARKRGQALDRAIPLNQSPMGMAFMAVDRRVDGCPMPLTATEYRGRR